jgi:hypothetical protein
VVSPHSCSENVAGLLTHSFSHSTNIFLGGQLFSNSLLVAGGTTAACYLLTAGFWVDRAAEIVVTEGGEAHS